MTADTVIDGELSTQGWNRYSYCHNNPIVYKDPTGHERDWKDTLNEGCQSIKENIASAGEKLLQKPVELAEKFRDYISPKIDRVASKANKNPGTMLAIGLGGGLAIAAAPIVAPLAVSAVKGIGAKKGIDMAFGAVQGLLTYGATTPVKDWTPEGAATSMSIGAGTGYVGNMVGGLKIISKAPAGIKALSSGSVSGVGNLSGQVLSGKDSKKISWASAGWSTVTGGFGSYLGLATNLAKPASDLVGKGAMIVPSASGAAMINMAEKQMKKE